MLDFCFGTVFTEQKLSEQKLAVRLAGKRRKFLPKRDGIGCDMKEDAPSSWSPRNKSLRSMARDCRNCSATAYRQTCWERRSLLR